jgi:phosphonate transport system substrate-binding protein
MKKLCFRLGLGLWFGCISSVSHALVFAINEGVSYRISNEDIQARYEGIATDLGTLLQQSVTIESVAAYPKLRQGLAAKTYDLAMVHPAHISIGAMKNSGYKLVAITKGYQQYTAHFLTMPGSPLKSLADLNGKKLGIPDEDSITSWIVRATLRDALGPNHNVQYFYTRYQDAVPFLVENKFTAAGASAAPGVIKGWQDKKYPIFAKSKPVPIKHIIASPKLTEEQMLQVRNYLVNLDATEAGRKKLLPTKYTGFTGFDEADMMAIGKWLGI